jgi:hypothetical protein
MRPRVVLVAVAVAIAPRVADADDRLAAGYAASRPIAGDSSGLASTIIVRWEHRFTNALEVGVGGELGYSRGDESLTRAALLPSLAWSRRAAEVSLRIEGAAGPQLVYGRVTLDGIPLRGLETRGFHAELAAMLEAELSRRVDLRAGGGIMVDGLYPVGHSSTKASPFVACIIVVALGR